MATGDVAAMGSALLAVSALFSYLLMCCVEGMARTDLKDKVERNEKEKRENSVLLGEDSFLHEAPQHTDSQLQLFTNNLTMITINESDEKYQDIALEVDSNSFQPESSHQYPPSSSSMACFKHDVQMNNLNNDTNKTGENRRQLEWALWAKDKMNKIREKSFVEVDNRSDDAV